ncbi:MAG: Hsp70 family protein [Bacteroidales bacterium]|nr:Hsp70 family protein [Bacteroidales bacterium]
MDESRRVYGIDLGTTYSCIARIDEHDQPIVLQNSEGDLTTPSVVFFESEKACVVGKEAKQNLALEPQKTVCFIKREMSKEECFKKPTKHPYGEDPVEISARILRKVVDDANFTSGESIKDVVITCPAYFGNNERERTRQAGIIAGLNVINIINEPTAAAISYGLKSDGEQSIMVYDLGGGTFDVTIIHVKGGNIRVVATDGKHDLGGADWDECLAEYMLEKFNEEHGTSYSLHDNDQLYYTFMLEAENLKKALTPEGKTEGRRPVNWDGKTSRITVSRDTFDALTGDKLQMTIDIANQVIATAKKLEPSLNIDEVILVGGSSRMPQIKKRVDAEYHCDARINDPDQCVAKGAALFAMNEKYTEMAVAYEDGEADYCPKTLPSAIRAHVINVTSKTYGTDVGEHDVQNVIFSNSQLPAHEEYTFYTSCDNQSVVPAMIFESTVTDRERDQVIKMTNAKLLTDQKMQVKGLYPAKTPFKMVFDLSENGLLKVHCEIGNETLDYELEITGVRSEQELAKAAKRLQESRIE